MAQTKLSFRILELFAACTSPRAKPAKANSTATCNESCACKQTEPPNPRSASKFPFGRSDEPLASYFRQASCSLPIGHARVLIGSLADLRALKAFSLAPEPAERASLGEGGRRSSHAPSRSARPPLGRAECRFVVAAPPPPPCGLPKITSQMTDGNT